LFDITLDCLLVGLNVAEDTQLRRGECFVEVGVNSGREGWKGDKVVLVSDYLTSSGALAWHGFIPLKKGDMLFLNSWASKTLSIQVRFAFLWGFPFEE